MRGGIVQGSSREYALEAQAFATYDALEDVVRERRFEVVAADPRHRRLSFTLRSQQAAAGIEVRFAVLDAGHGVSKLVVVCSDDVLGSAVAAPEELLEGLVVDVRRRLHPVREELPQRALA